MQRLAFKILIVSAALFWTCGQQTGEQKSAVEDPPLPMVKTADACYRHAAGGDTVLLRLSESNNTVTGTLYIHYREKDRNQGAIKGVMNNDTLFADYTFMSEGIASVRQVAFLRRGETFVEGFGPVSQQGDKTIFTNPAALDFSGHIVLEPVPCP